MATPLHKKPCPGGHEIYTFGRPFFGYHYYTLSFVWTMLRSREDDLLKKYVNFTLSTLKITSPLSGGYEIYHFLSSCPTNFVKIGSIVLSDSGDLKYEYLRAS